MNNLFKLSVPVLLATLAGCGTTPSQEIAEEVSARHQEVVDARNEQIEETVSQMPSWAIEPPQADATGIYAVGHGKSADPYTAIKIAKLQAKFELAMQLKSEIIGQERSATEQSGAGVPSTQYSELIDNLVSRTYVAGYNVVEEPEIIAINGEAHAYILVHMPFERFNEALKSLSSPKDFEQRFKDLEERVKSRESEKAPAEVERSAQIQQSPEVSAHHNSRQEQIASTVTALAKVHPASKFLAEIE